VSRSRQPSQQERAAAFGARVRQLRRASKLTQREVAERIPMSGGNVSRIENGDQGPPSEEIIARLAQVLEVDESELLELAGRAGTRADFERQVLEELQELRAEIRAGFDRLEASVAGRSRP
jgi:transcriptional regulator with XRE-family HTH domain